MWETFARLVVRWAWLVVLGWVAAAVLSVAVLPSIDEAGSGSLGDLVPVGAEAIDAEKRSAELFAFPFASRTTVVERDPDGLPPDRLARNLALAADVNRKLVPELRRVEGAYGVTNAIPGLAFRRERNTAATTSLLFRLELGTGSRTTLGERYADALEAPPSSYVGVTGAIPARKAQARAIRDRLPLVELATVVLVALTVGLYLRSIVAPLVTLLAVGIAYVGSIRVIATVGEAIGVSVPSEVEPVLVALLFGVVTDYALFFMSRFRALVAEGAGGADAARRTTAELTPIIVTCGLAVAAGAGTLALAKSGFLKAFGPGMAIAVALGMVVVVTLIPAALALLGPRLFWPSSPGRSARTPRPGPNRTSRLIGLAVDRPRSTIAVSLALVAAMGSGVLFMEIGNPLIRGLPAGSEPRVAYGQVSKAFAPGVLAPATLVLESPGIAERRRALASLQAVLASQPGVAGVIGPATPPADRVPGAVVAADGDAARFVLIAGNDPLGAAAIRLQRNLGTRIDDLVDAVGLPAARASFAGDTALSAETIDAANADVRVVLPAVLLAVALVLAVFLRALVAPVYLVVLAALAPLAALGLAVGLFQGILGHAEITYFVPIVAGVLLVALGSDYNVFIAGSIWAEVRRRPLREAIVAGGGGAAHAIAAAGVVLAASFAALALVPVSAFQELAFVLAAGLLIDAFLIRLVLAPAVIAIAERRRGHRRAGPVAAEPA